MIEPRPEGYYWVRRSPKAAWEPAEWNPDASVKGGGFWGLVGDWRRIQVAEVGDRLEPPK